MWMTLCGAVGQSISTDKYTLNAKMSSHGSWQSCRDDSPRSTVSPSRGGVTQACTSHKAATSKVWRHKYDKPNLNAPSADTNACSCNSRTSKLLSCQCQQSCAVVRRFRFDTTYVEKKGWKPASRWNHIQHRIKKYLHFMYSKEKAWHYIQDVNARMRRLHGNQLSCKLH